MPSLLLQPLSQVIVLYSLSTVSAKPTGSRGTMACQSLTMNLAAVCSDVSS